METALRYENVKPHFAKPAKMGFCSAVSCAAAAGVVFATAVLYRKHYWRSRLLGYEGALTLIVVSNPGEVSTVQLFKCKRKPLTWDTPEGDNSLADMFSARPSLQTALRAFKDKTGAVPEAGKLNFVAYISEGRTNTGMPIAVYLYVTSKLAVLAHEREFVETALAEFRGLNYCDLRKPLKAALDSAEVTRAIARALHEHRA